MIAYPAVAEARNDNWRFRRIAAAIAVVWMVGACDFLFTLLEARLTDFIELNPLAAALVSGPLLPLALYKFGLLGGATWILLRLRDHRESEWGALLLAASHGVLAAYWGVYFGVRFLIF